jgi:hypothetical protein
MTFRGGLGFGRRRWLTVHQIVGVLILLNAAFVLLPVGGDFLDLASKIIHGNGSLGDFESLARRERRFGAINASGPCHHLHRRAETGAWAISELRDVMDQFLLLRFAHLVGLMLMPAGLIGVFVADMRSRQVHDVKLFAQVVTFIAVFYDGLAAGRPVAAGERNMAHCLVLWRLGVLRVPWLVGMVILFAAEFIEGNTITVSISWAATPGASSAAASG